QSAAFEGRLAEGTARANRLELVLDGLRAEGSGTATLRAPFQFQSQAQLNAPDLSRFAELAEALLGLEGLAGRAEFSADADGTLEPLDFAASGSAGVASLQLAGLTVDSFRTQYALEETRLRLSELAVELYGGRAAGEAVAPLEPNVPGSADLKWSGIDAGRIAADVLDLPWDVRGETAGSVELTLPAAGESGRRDWTLAASFDVPELQVESIVLGEIHGSASRRDGVIDYEVAASLLGGTLDLDGRWAPGAEDRTVDEGRLVLQNVKLDRLAAAASEARGAAPLGGTVALRANYTHMAADGLPAGRGTAAVSDLTWRNARLSERVEAVARWDGAHVVLESISGAAFGGSLAGQAVVNLDRKRPATFALRLRSGELERALAAWPEAAQNVSGPFELSLRGAVGERISAVASVTSTRPTVAGLRLSRLRLPVRIESGLPGEGRTVLRVHSAAAGAAHGRVTGNLRVTAGRRFDIKGDVKFDQLDTGSLVPRGGSGLGRLSGSMTIEGRRVTSIDDLSGRIDARLGRTRPRDLPLMAELQPYLGSRFSQGDVADAGSLRARFRRGTLSIERFSLDGDTCDVYADGTVHRSGRLDLDVAARTGQQTGAGGPLGAFLLERFPLAGATPVGLALQANRFVSERVVYLRVTGTVQRPAVSVQTGRVLQDEALRFFLQNIR
ncbi:MAG: AsmA-like C-terminal region-containing protein, partial [Planctomycetes bacterium]|nr:AsmA-like C-terminal region-containing protein [Planctomycetota bacterium]